ncbi:hypothetical protein ACFX12_028747 [Malus domestica]
MWCDPKEGSQAHTHTHIYKLMRFVFCKIHCPPFICFCKPNSPHIYTPGPLKLQNSPTTSPPLPNSRLEPVPETSDHLSDEETTEIIKEERLLGNANPQPATAQPCLKSSLRKPNSDSGAPKQEVLRKRVQWTDFLGKQLVDVREFECSEPEDTDNEDDNRRGCICVIL